MIRDNNKYRALLQEMHELEPVVSQYQEYIETIKKISECDEMIKGSQDDREFVSLAKDEKESEEKKLIVLTEKLKVALIPRDPEDGKNVIIEIAKSNRL